MDVHSSLIHHCQTWKQPRCASVGEWMNKLWSIQTMEYCSVLKRNELSGHEKTWRELKRTLLSERRQPEKPERCVVPTTWHSEKADYGHSKKTGCCQGMRSWSTRGLRAVKLFCVVLQRGIHVIVHVSKIH